MRAPQALQVSHLGRGALLEVVSDSFDLATFLRRTVDFGVASLGCSGGSAFLYDAAFKRLELTSHDYQESLWLSLEPGQGVAGIAFQERKIVILPRRDLTRKVVRIEELRAEEFRAIAAIPVPLENPQAVFCFDFSEPKPKGARTNGLTPSEAANIKKLAKELHKNEFSYVLHQARAHEALARIRKAGAAPGRLRDEASDLLTDLYRVFSQAGKPKPDFAGVQIVDRRRDVIRTVQSSGLPITFHMAVSHPLSGPESNADIQAVVANTCTLQIIVGNDKQHFDQAVYRRFKHKEFVRLWIPLFPIPLTKIFTRSMGDLDSTLNRWVKWGSSEQRGAQGRAIVSKWNQNLLPGPSPEIVFGTLEVGFRRIDQNKLEFAPLTTELASWVAVQVWKLAKPLFETTFAGALEEIGHSVAASVAESTVLQVAMPDWRNPERREYPIDGPWPLAVPAKVQALHLSLKPAEVAFPGPLPNVDNATSSTATASLRSALKTAAEDSIRHALRLDDYMSDPYLLVSELEDRHYVGTEAPDPKLEPLLREICREAGAEECWMLESGLGKPFGSNPLGDKAFRVTRSAANLVAPVPQVVEKIREVVEDGNPWLGSLGSWQYVTVLPLEFADESRAALILIHPQRPLGSTEWKAIESRVARWVHRFSLRRLVVMDRYSFLMRRLRAKIAEVRRSAEQEEEKHLNCFVKKLFTEIFRYVRARGVVLTLYSTSSSHGLDMVHRFWSCKKAKQLRFDSYRFIDRQTFTPAHRAADEGVVLYQPTDPLRLIETETVNLEFLKRAGELRADGYNCRAARIEHIVELARGTSTTMVVAPLSSKGSLLAGSNSALTVFLKGNHQFDETRKQSVLELTDLLADGIGEMQRLDQRVFEKKHSRHLDRLRESFAKAKSDDEIVGYLFAGMGRSSWGLADDAVLWVLDSVTKELVVRSARGRGLRVLNEHLIIGFNQHPFLSTYLSKYPRKRRPKIGKFVLALFPVNSESDEAVSRAYAKLQAKWLMSFALRDSDGSVFGILDCLRDKPLAPEEEAALKKVLSRLSLQFCAGIERTRHKWAINFARVLTEVLMHQLSLLRASDAYTELVRRIRQEMACGVCDLFLERDGKMLLHTTTRDKGPQTTAERYDYWLEPEKGSDIVSNTLMDPRQSRIEHASIGEEPSAGYSRRLAALLAKDTAYERIALPLRLEEAQKGRAAGLLYLRGPLSRTILRDDSLFQVKKSGCLTREHLRRARDLSVVVQRLVAMAGLVEQQEWLVNELQHAIGQPLQGLRIVGDDAIRALFREGATTGYIATIRQRLDRSCDLVQEVRDHLAAIMKMGQPTELRLTSVNLTDLVQECCKFKMSEAETRSCSILSERVEQLEPIMADATWLRQAILNLLDNAVKYSFRERTIAVILSESERGVLLEVSNFGIGIPKRDLQRIFNPFFRSKVPDQMGARRGSGVGLAIVEYAIERLHQGTVRVFSKPTRRARVGKTARQIANIQHETTFRVTLYRRKLERLAENLNSAGE